jgi:[ribosomal protein S5]-alanine N-acetyltransferase
MDAESLQRHADNRQIWINLRDRFPHPYTPGDAHAFIAVARSMDPETYFAIEVDAQAAGGIGYVLHEDVERVSAEIGYWLGEPYWNRGITTEALAAVTALAIERHGLTRVYAVPFEYNTASCRVLEKCGYVLEARLKRSAIKDGRIVDQFQYAYLNLER